MQPLQGSKSPAHFCLSMLLSSTVKAPCKALVSIFEVQRRLPRESGRDNQYCVTASYIRRRSSFPELGRGHPLLAALIGLAGSRHRAGKPRDLSPQRLERCSSRTPRHFSHSLEQTPPFLSFPTAQDPVSHTCTFITYQTWLHSQVHGKQKDHL